MQLCYVVNKRILEASLFNSQSVTFSTATCLIRSILHRACLGKLECRPAPKSLPGSSGFYDGLESAVEHALHIERHRRFHQLRQTRISHHLCVNAITVFTRLEHDVGEQYRLAGLGFDSARKRLSHFDVQIVAGALAEFECAVFSPDFASLLRPAAIVVQVLLQKRDDKSINIMSHGYPLVALT